ncbi:hypothetical protein KC19_9G070300 [Ceratodon purpureus]|uniref:Uncharacterized protein n=1 Tax=Ceratodon purpureus TaxID=3225 RepID=A0A8T0GX81_CERPU|nr:hypothetical protein KC19_9G070300 [Ceratodon purpureus]
MGRGFQYNGREEVTRRHQVVRIDAASKCGSDHYYDGSGEGEASGRHEGASAVEDEERCPQMQFRQILKRIVETKESMGDTLKASAFSLTEAKYAAGDNIKYVVFENMVKATINESFRVFVD